MSLVDQAVAESAAEGYGAWNPGLESELPHELLPLATVFRPENVSTSLAQAFELGDCCGLPPQELVAFRPERLIIHELLVRVTADLAVPDGTTYEDLGRNFREIAATILDKYIAPHADELKLRFAQVRGEAAAFIARQLAGLAGSQPAPAAAAGEPGRRRWFGLTRRSRQPPVPSRAGRAARTADHS